MMMLIQWLMVAIAFFLIELAYFSLALRYNIVDRPNERSSHRRVTLRGGGVVFPISVLAYFLFFGWQYAWFVVGMLAISLISFADDVSHQPKRLRISIHLLAVLAMLYQVQLLAAPWWLVPVWLVVCIGTINAYNFMDGINGITVGYGAVVVASLWVANRWVPFVDESYLLCLAAANLVFGFFNFRKRARCFAGDVGSVGMAFALLFPVLMLVKETGEPLFLLLFAVYGVDAGLTIAHRLLKKENIFLPHRQHLFQYLANEFKWPHLRVTTLYMIVQALVSGLLLAGWRWLPATGWWLCMMAVLLVLVLLHLWAKAYILRTVGKK